MRNPQPVFAFAVARGLGRTELSRFLAREAELRRGYRKPQYEGGGAPGRSGRPWRDRLGLA